MSVRIGERQESGELPPAGQNSPSNRFNESSMRLHLICEFRD
jgi:hypothetical protein